MWDLKQFGNRTAIIDDKGNIITYNELDCIQHQLAGNINKADNNRIIIFIICSNTLEAVAAYVSCINNHIVPLMLSSEIKDTALEKLYDTYLPEYIWMPSDRISSGKKVYEYMTYKLVKMYDNHTPINDELALLLSTSGTTGSRKSVRISYENIKINTMQIVKALSINENDRAVTMLPMHYTYGLSVINTHLYAGGSLLLTDKKVFSKSFWDFFNENKGTSISGVAYTYKMLRKLGFEKWEIPYLKKITQAGEKLPLNLYKYLTQIADTRKINFYPMYGQTEATARITIMPEGMAKYKSGSVGLPLDGGIIDIVTENGQRIYEYNKTGKIIYKGLNVAMGYSYTRNELAEGNSLNGVLDTGDYGYIDNEGYLFVEGRKDEYVKVAGNRISLQELEAILEENFKSSEFCVKYENGKLKIASTFKNSKKVLDYINEITDLNPKMADVKYYESIPILDNGKVNIKF
ncbi:MAG: AMP-binding protein [Lachnospiraceae bacterium]|nr:AMP-binding protein [Lachnospiraceae bacterium]